MLCDMLSNYNYKIMQYIIDNPKLNQIKACTIEERANNCLCTTEEYHVHFTNKLLSYVERMNLYQKVQHWRAKHEKVQYTDISLSICECKSFS